jgi:hypothetical protein
MGPWSLVRSLNRDQRNTFTASFLGWTLDAFDYFVVTFVVIHFSQYSSICSRVFPFVSGTRNQQKTRPIIASIA